MCIHHVLTMLLCCFLDRLSMRGKGDVSSPPDHYPDRSEELLMYSLPHHVDSMEEVIGSSNSETGYCSGGLHGEACLIRGGEWVMKEELDGPPNFAAPRPPHHSAIPSLAKGIANDISFELPDNYMRGAGVRIIPYSLYHQYVFLTFCAYTLFPFISLSILFDA
jgi:hypothetical protein